MLAQAATTTTTGTTDAPFWTNPFLPLIVIAVVFYLFVFRGKRSQDKERKGMLSNLKKGDRVQTIGGIMGTVIEARETEVVLKVDETSNVKMRFSRSAIHRVVVDEADKK